MALSLLRHFSRECGLVGRGMDGFEQQNGKTQ
jgi:hypothetical protein